MCTGPVLREEEKKADDAAPAEEGGSFLMESLGDWNRAAWIGMAMAIPALHMDVSNRTTPGVDPIFVRPQTF